MRSSKLIKGRNQVPEKKIDKLNDICLVLTKGLMETDFLTVETGGPVFWHLNPH